MKLQDRGRPDNDRNLGDSVSPDEDGAETEKQSVKWSEARRPSAPSVEDEKLMSKRKVFRDQGLGTAGPRSRTTEVMNSTMRLATVLTRAF